MALNFGIRNGWFRIYNAFMHIKKLDHSALIVSDLARTRHFYGEVLGMLEVARPDNFTFAGCWFRGEGFELHFICESDTTAVAGFGDLGTGAKKGLAHHLGLEVENIRAVESHLRTNGVPIVAGPLPRGDGVTQLYVLDPDGTFLEFFQWDPESNLVVEERGAVSRNIR